MLLNRRTLVLVIICYFIYTWSDKVLFVYAIISQQRGTMCHWKRDIANNGKNNITTARKTFECWVVGVVAKKLPKKQDSYVAAELRERCADSLRVYPLFLLARPKKRLITRRRVSSDFHSEQLSFPWSRARFPSLAGLAAARGVMSWFEPQEAPPRLFVFDAAAFNSSQIFTISQSAQPQSSNGVWLERFLISALWPTKLQTHNGSMF